MKIIEIIYSASIFRMRAPRPLSFWFYSSSIEGGVFALLSLNFVSRKTLNFYFLSHLSHNIFNNITY
jgi:hypothetical protein